MTDPILYIRATRSKLGVILYCGVCPYCGETHTHGGGFDKSTDLLGTRLSHCSTKRRIYTLMFLDEPNLFQEKLKRSIK